MSQIKTTQLTVSLLGAGFVAAALVALPAQASTLLLNSASMNQAYTAQITGGVFGSGGLNVYEGPLTFSVTDGSGTHNITAFCVDLFDEIDLGTFSPSLQYQTESLTTTRDVDGQQLGTGLSVTQLTQINRLVTLASGLEVNASTNAANLAAIQGAIWMIENPTYTVTSHNSLDSMTSGYITQSLFTNPVTTGYLPTGVETTIISSSTYHQAFTFSVPGGVPEPATWAMMIIGFGGVGAVRRKRRKDVAFA